MGATTGAMLIIYRSKLLCSEDNKVEHDETIIGQPPEPLGTDVTVATRITAIGTVTIKYRNTYNELLNTSTLTLQPSAVLQICGNLSLSVIH